jgi:death-on-curing protein
LESALARPLNRVGYGEPDAAELAAVYALAIVPSNPFVDGNKRTAYVALETFLVLNDMEFPVDDADAVIAMLRLAAGDISDQEFIAWVRDNARPPP